MRGRQLLISVVIPCYNAEKHLTECLESCLNQKFDSFEIVCVNDGSYDSTPFLLNSFQVGNPRIRVIHQPNRGVTAARLEGVRQAKGDYIFFCDADDWLFPHALDALSRNSGEMVDMIRGQAGDGSTASLCVKNKRLSGINMLRHFLVYGGTSLWGTLYRRDLLLAQRWDFRLRWGEDLAMNCQVCAQAREVVVISETVYCYRKNEESVTQKAPESVFLTWRLAKNGVYDCLRAHGILNGVFVEWLCCEFRLELTLLATAIRRFNNFDSPLRQILWHSLFTSPLSSMRALNRLRGSLRLFMPLAFFSPAVAAMAFEKYARLRRKLREKKK